MLSLFGCENSLFLQDICGIGAPSGISLGKKEVFTMIKAEFRGVFFFIGNFAPRAKLIAAINHSDRYPFHSIGIIIIESHNISRPAKAHHTSEYLGGGGLLLWQRGRSKIWLDDLEFGEKGLGQFVADAGVDDNIITWDPVDWSGDAVLVTGLEGIENSEDFGGVAAGRGWVGEDEADSLLGVNNEH